MHVFKLLVAEDNDNEMTTCRRSVKIIQHESGRPIDLIECKTVEEALQKIDNSFDGAIIDLKLGEIGDEGNQILKKIQDSLFRLPVAIMTATPDNVDNNFTYLGVFTKSTTKYADILNTFFEIHDTGLTRIMGGRGKIEETLNEVFLKNLLPQLDVWKAYGKEDSSITEKALLRFTLNHLLQLLDDDNDKCFPEEFYLNLFPPHSEKIKTGRIIKKKNTQDYFVILNPACDLAIRKDGQSKTDQLLIVKIDDQRDYIKEKLKELKKGKREERLKKIFGNADLGYYHWLPETKLLPETNPYNGGFLNFRILFTLSKHNFENDYETIPLQISPHFVKDILSRFSSYYARQGQPDINCDRIIDKIIASFENGE